MLFFAWPLFNKPIPGETPCTQIRCAGVFWIIMKVLQMRRFTYLSAFFTIWCKFWALLKHVKSASNAITTCQGVWTQSEHDVNSDLSAKWAESFYFGHHIPWSLDYLGPKYPQIYKKITKWTNLSNWFANNIVIL